MWSKKMRYVALACDYDGTLATQGKVEDDVIKVLTEVVASGRYLILLTGRTLEALFEIFPDVDLFEYVICENGAVLYRPATKVAKLLAEPPPGVFIERLRARDVVPLDIGQVMVSTWHPNESTVLEVSHELGLDLQISFNKGAVMVLPSGTTKATGLLAALSELGLSKHNVVGIGDAENDHSFLSMCEFAVAVANALPVIKEQADLTTNGDHGAGVIELAKRLLSNDLKIGGQSIDRHDIVLGRTIDNAIELKFKPYDYGLLIAGPSQSGKSTVSMAILEHLATVGYQYCVIDPEGDYERAPRAIIIGNRHYAPEVDDVLRILENPQDNVVVNLLGLALADRPPFFASIFPKLQNMRRVKGHPHWLMIDEAHHMLHPYWDDTLKHVWQQGAIAIVTVDPTEISARVLSDIDLVLAVGKDPSDTLQSFANCVGQKLPERDHITLDWGETLAWFRHQYGPPIRLTVAKSPLNRQRHLRKYANGNVGKERSFYFRGPHGSQNIRAQNLLLFVQIGEGVDDETWLFHLRSGDYSNWFQNIIRDNTLAEETRKVEQTPNISAAESRAQIKKLIEERYTTPIRSMV
jgi:hydroxymethylpyrimidine pyrophosphatase-like HAD family hydrolase